MTQGLPDGNNAQAAHQRLKTLLSQASRVNLEIAKDLYVTFHQRYYEVHGYDTFGDYVEQALGISRSKAERLRRIWAHFVKKLGVRIETLAEIGYMNALTLLPVINEGNAEEWIEKAKTLSWRALTQEIKNARGGEQAAQPSEQAGQAGPTETVSADEDTGGALSGGGEAVDSGDPAPAPTTKPAGQDDKTKLTFSLYPTQRTVVEAALDEVRRSRPDEVPPNEALAHIATEFLASRMSKEESPVVRIRLLLDALGRAYGGRFVWVKNEDAAALLLETIEAHPELFSEQ